MERGSCFGFWRMENVPRTSEGSHGWSTSTLFWQLSELSQGNQSACVDKYRMGLFISLEDFEEEPVRGC